MSILPQADQRRAERTLFVSHYYYQIIDILALGRGLEILTGDVSEDYREGLQVGRHHRSGEIGVNDPGVDQSNTLHTHFGLQRGVGDLEVEVDILHIERTGVRTNVTATGVARRRFCRVEPQTGVAFPTW